METHPNIDYNKFPEQNTKLYDSIDLLVNGLSTTATIVRWDLESPNKIVYKTMDNFYISDNELENFKKVEQGSFVGRKVEVCFNYDTSKLLEGVVVRDDVEKPYEGFILLDDKRLVSMVECQYSLKRKMKEENEYLVNPLTSYMIGMISRISRIKNSQRPAFLHGLYKQLVPSRKKRIVKGALNDYDNFSKSIDSKVPETGHSIKRMIFSVLQKESALILADEMSKYEQFNDHVERINSVYAQDGPIILNVCPRNYGLN